MSITSMRVISTTIRRIASDHKLLPASVLFVSASKKARNMVPHEERDRISGKSAQGGLLTAGSLAEHGSLLYVEWVIPAPINCGMHLCDAHAQLMSRDEHLVQGPGKPALSLFL
jgi:hypothetical protein